MLIHIKNKFNLVWNSIKIEHGRGMFTNEIVLPAIILIKFYYLIINCSIDTIIPQNLKKIWVRKFVITLVGQFILPFNVHCLDTAFILAGGDNDINTSTTTATPSTSSSTPAQTSTDTPRLNLRASQIGALICREHLVPDAAASFSRNNTGLASMVRSATIVGLCYRTYAIEAILSRIPYPPSPRTRSHLVDTTAVTLTPDFPMSYQEFFLFHANAVFYASIIVAAIISGIAFFILSRLRIHQTSQWKIAVVVCGLISFYLMLNSGFTALSQVPYMFDWSTVLSSQSRNDYVSNLTNLATQCTTLGLNELSNLLLLHSQAFEVIIKYTVDCMFNKEIYSDTLFNEYMGKFNETASNVYSYGLANTNPPAPIKIELLQSYFKFAEFYRVFTNGTVKIIAS